jgi:hypothetical protein
VIPSYLLRQDATVEPYLGTAGNGSEKYGPAVPRKINLEHVTSLTVELKGKKERVTGKALFRPDVLPDNSRVICDGRTYRVLSVKETRVGGRPYSLEVLLG